jgi:hypothetical protein
MRLTPSVSIHAKLWSEPTLEENRPLPPFWRHDSQHNIYKSDTQFW